ncbi:MAG: endonuclease [Paludibacteraceae bacterium]|nr:endonuclease [Paludibacteraceae bacterium]
MNKIRLYSLILILCSASLLAEQMPEGYYNSINGLKDGELKGTLKTCIRKHTVIPYGNGSNSTWEVFYYSDQDENGYCMDMYCDDWKKFSSPGNEISGCNIEHSFAKSWWGGAKNDAYKDCYHLNPSNSTANSARSNYPLGVPQKEIKTSGSLRIGKIHHDALNTDFYVFEPKDEYKGDFARAYFYMATCYGKDKNGDYDPTICSQYKGWRLDNKDVGSKFAMQNDNYLEFQPWEQEILIQWHRQDPVSEKEIKRADAVSNFQHNRNPFIDYPYLAEFIWGEKAGQAVYMNQLMASFDADFVPGKSNGWRGGDPDPGPDPGTDPDPDPEEALDTPNGTINVNKTLINGLLYIMINDQIYTVTGQRVQ